MPYTQVDGVLMGTCDLAKYHSISLYVNDRYYFKLSPDAYVVDIGHAD